MMARFLARITSVFRKQTPATKSRSLAEIHDRIQRFSAIGVQRNDAGVLFVGKVPFIAPQAWLHIIFPPLGNDAFQKMQSKLSQQTPDQFRVFLLEANGCSLFSGALEIFGHRFNFERTGDAAWQPFSIETPNVLSRIRDARDTMLFIGSSDYHPLYVDTRDGSIHKCTRESVTSLKCWSTFDDMVIDEVSRYDSHFDSGGHRVRSLP